MAKMVFLCSPMLKPCAVFGAGRAAAIQLHVRAVQGGTSCRAPGFLNAAERHVEFPRHVAER